MYTNTILYIEKCLPLIFNIDKSMAREIVKNDKFRFNINRISDDNTTWKATMDLIYDKEKGFHPDLDVKKDIGTAIDVFNEYSQLMNKVEKYFNSYDTTDHLYILSNIFVVLEIYFKKEKIEGIRFLINHRYALDSARFDFNGDFNYIKGIKGEEKFREYLGNEGKIDSIEIFQNNQLSGGIFSSLVPLFEQTFNIEKGDMSIPYFLTLIEMSEI